MSVCLIVDYSILNYTRKLVRIFQKHCRIYMSLSENIPRVLVRPYLMTLYVILWIHLNFLIRSRFVLKAIIPEKNHWIVLVFFLRKFCLFQKEKYDIFMICIFMILYMHVVFDYFFHFITICFYFFMFLYLSFIYSILFNARISFLIFIRDFLSSSFPLKADPHSANLSCAIDTILWQMGFFRLHLRRAKFSVYLTNLFVLLTRSSHWNVFGKIII